MHLLGRDLDVRVATDVLGWGNVGESRYCSICISKAKENGDSELETLKGEFCGSYISEADAEYNRKLAGTDVLPSTTHEQVPNFHENSYAVERVEERIRQMSLEEEYNKALDELTANHPMSRLHPDKFGQEVLKTRPHQRCYAALLAVGSSIDTNEELEITGGQ